jgi:hypothetical protein
MAQPAVAQRCTAHLDASIWLGLTTPSSGLAIVLAEALEQIPVFADMFGRLFRAFSPLPWQGRGRIHP